MDGEIRFVEPPRSEGFYKINEGLYFAGRKKPMWFHRKMIELFFGWKWVDKI